MKGQRWAAAVSSTARDAKRCQPRVSRQARPQPQGLVRPWRDVETLLGEENGACLQGRKAADVAGAALELSKPRLTQCTVTGEGCRHGVSPGSQIGCEGLRSCAAATQPTMPQGKMHTPGGEIWHGIAGPGVNLQKLRQAKQNTAVVLEGKRGSEGWRQRPEYVLRFGAGTKEEQQPRDLEVWDRWKDLEEGTMLRGKGLKIRSDILIRTEGSSKDPDSETGGRSGGSTPREFHTRVFAALRRM